MEAEAASAAPSVAGATNHSTKRALPSLPFRLKVRYGPGALRVDSHAPESTEASMAAAAAVAHSSSVAASTSAASASAASPYLVHDGCASTVDLPCISFSASPLQLHLRLLLFPAHKRAEVGRFLSSMHALQRSLHFIFGWDCWQRKIRATDEKSSSEASTAASAAATASASADDADCVFTLDGVSYPILHLRLWSNPSLASDRLQIVEAQRALLGGLPEGLARLFGQRDMDHLLRAVVRSVYRAHGLPTQHVHTPPINNAATSASSENGATLTAATPRQAQAEQFDIRFDESLAQLLTLVQDHLSRSSFAPSSTPAAAAPLSRPPPGFPALPLPSSSAAPASAASSSSAASDLCSLLPPNLPLPLWSGLSRPLQSSLTLLGKSVAFVHSIDVQMPEEDSAAAPSTAAAAGVLIGAASGSMDPPSQMRQVRVAMQGCDWPSVHAFLQERLATHSNSGSNEHSNPAISSATSSSALLRLRFAECARAASSFKAWLGWWTQAQKNGAEKKE